MCFCIRFFFMLGHDGAIYGLAVDSSDDSILMSCGADGKNQKLFHKRFKHKKQTNHCDYLAFLLF